MKKFLLTILCALFGIYGMAQSEKIYTEPLVVTVDGESTEPQDASVTVVDNGDGTINFVLNNFFLGAGEESLPVGNVSVANIPTTEASDGLTYFSFTGPITIEPGNVEGMSDTDWYGPMLGEIPLVLNGKMNDEKLFVTIDIDMQNILGQVVYVQLGTDDFAVAAGKIYTEPLVVTVDGESTEPQDASVTVVDNGDGTINFVLNNFFLGAGEESLPVGNVSVANIPTTEASDGLTYFTFTGPITIEPGNVEGMSDTDWYGPMLGEIPLVLNGKMNDEKLFVTIDIDMQNILGQVVYVQLGTDDFVVSKKGDVNGDSEITIADGVAVLNAMAGEEVSGDADVNGDGEVTIADFVAVLNLMAEQ